MVVVYLVVYNIVGRITRSYKIFSYKMLTEIAFRPHTSVLRTRGVCFRVPCIVSSFKFCSEMADNLSMPFLFILRKPVLVNDIF